MGRLGDGPGPDERGDALCQPAQPQAGRDLPGLDDTRPFHPTAVGVIRIAANIAVTIAQPQDPTTKQP